MWYTNVHSQVVRGYLAKKTANVLDLFQCRNHPVIVSPQLFHKFGDPLKLLRLSILEQSNAELYQSMSTIHISSAKGNDSRKQISTNIIGNMTNQLPSRCKNKHHARFTHLRSAVVQYFDMCAESLVYDLCGDVFAVRQTPQQPKYLHRTNVEIMLELQQSLRHITIYGIQVYHNYTIIRLAAAYLWLN